METNNLASGIHCRETGIPGRTSSIALPSFTQEDFTESSQTRRWPSCLHPHRCFIRHAHMWNRNPFGIHTANWKSRNRVGIMHVSDFVYQSPQDATTLQKSQLSNQGAGSELTKPLRAVGRATANCCRSHLAVIPRSLSS